MLCSFQISKCVPNAVMMFEKTFKLLGSIGMMMATLEEEHILVKETKHLTCP